MKIKTEQGYFDTIKNEYVITNMKPVRTLKNYLWNEMVVGWYDQFGCGITNGKTNGVFRTLTNYPKFIYVKDLKDKTFYSPNRNFNDLPFDKFECHVGLGYQRVISEYNGLQFEITTVIPRDDYAEITHIKIKNISKEEKKIATYFYNKPFVNLTWHDAFGNANINKKNNGILFKHVGFNVPEKNNHVFTKTDYTINSFDVTDLNFKGIYNEISNPIDLHNDALSNEPSIFDGEYCTAFDFRVTLKSEEEKEINVACCFGKNEEEVFSIANKYCSNEKYYSELEHQKELHERLNEKLTISTGNDYIDNLINVWLKRQISLGKTWGRVYGKGFRDIMQDVSSFLSLDSTLAKSKILSTLEYQFISGNTIRQFDPVFDYPYQDGACWISSTVLAYLKETNDSEILDLKVKYYDSDLQETVFEHMERGYKYLLNDLGEHELVKWRGGDWNDSIDNAGMKGIGESVWLSIATVKGINDFLEIIGKFKNNYNIDYFITSKNKLEQNIIKYGFEGDRYIYGIDDLSRKIGSTESEEVKIFLNPQTWSVMANINTHEVQEKVMDSVEKNLKCDYGYLQSYPAFSKADDTIGRLSYFSPGTYENGSVYNHGVAFKIYADLILKRADSAYESLKMILPTNPKNKNNGMEPFAIANMYFGPQATIRSGFAPSSWITGTAGWLYQAVSKMFIGIKPDYDGIIIDPCLPKEIKDVFVRRVYQDTIFNIEIVKSNDNAFYVDGKKTNGNKVLLNGQKEIKVRFEYK